MKGLGTYLPDAARLVSVVRNDSLKKNIALEQLFWVLGVFFFLSLTVFSFSFFKDFLKLVAGEFVCVFKLVSERYSVFLGWKGKYTFFICFFSLGSFYLFAFFPSTNQRFLKPTAAENLVY